MIFGAVLLNFPAPLTVIQILWIHIICDGPPDITLSFEPKEKYLMRERPEQIQKEKILSGSMKFLIFAISLVTGLLSLFFFWYFKETTGDLDLARTISFATIGAVSLIYVFSFKNLKKPIFQTENFFKNKYLFLGVIYGFSLIFAAIYLPLFSGFLKTVPLSPLHWLLVFGVGFVAILIAELTKIVTNKKARVAPPAL